MLNKKKAQTWVKVVAWVLAGSFALSMTLLLAIPAQRGNSRMPGMPNNSVPSAPSSTNKTLTPIKGGKSASPVDGVLGQGDLALKNGQIDQAIGFYEKAYEFDKKDKAVQSKLGDAYYALGSQTTSTDKTKAKDAYEKYLKLLPDGPHVDHVKAALSQL